MAPKGIANRFALPGLSGYINPAGIAVGPDANLWIVDNGQGAIKGKIDRLDPKTGRFLAPFNVPDAYKIVMGPDRNMYFTGNFIGMGRITKTGVVTYFRNGGGFGLTVGSDGQYLAGRLGRLVPRSFRSKNSEVSPAGVSDVILGSQ